MTTDVKGMSFERYFTQQFGGYRHPYDISWDIRDAKITDSNGEVVFSQSNIECPASWSTQASNIVASKYFRSCAGAPREFSVKQLVDRVVKTICRWGWEDGYFEKEEDYEIFQEELTYLLINQYACFNSPVWFNIGVPNVPQQASACFILQVQDNLESILEWFVEEGKIFAGGSGSGTNISALRGKNEAISGGGKASGPLSFNMAADRIGNIIKSGGKCLPPYQHVFTEHGPVPVYELEKCGETGFFVLSYDPPSQRVKAKRAKAWKSGEKSIYRIITEYGNFDVSYDHPVRLSNGMSIEAQFLCAGVRLHSCAVDANNGDYSVDLQNGQWGFFHQMINDNALSTATNDVVDRVDNVFSERIVDISQDKLGERYVSVLHVQYIGIYDVYSVEVECETQDDKTPLSGHNYAIWPNENPHGCGIFVFNTRRSARMVIMNYDHPDIEDFIWCKVREEEKARVLINSGYDASMDGEAYTTVAFQNANHSVGVTDTFMRLAMIDGAEVNLVRRSDGQTARRVRARDLLRQAAEAAWRCADPGLQFLDTINKWHTCPNDGAIQSSNPCSEYYFLNNTACNLASFNLVKFLDNCGEFDVDGFKHAVDIMITAQEILVDRADYPTQKIADNSRIYRTLGLGYNNLGGLLMLKGLPYDSEEGRDYAAAITSLMTAEAYAQSARMARSRGSFEAFERNKCAMLNVIDMHIEQNHIMSSKSTNSIWQAAEACWQNARLMGAAYGIRNAQVTLLQPGGTVSFMMDCATTGIEPETALVKYKKLSGGGTLRIVNPLVSKALANLGYDSDAIKMICDYIDNNGSCDGISTSLLQERHLPIFDCAFPAVVGGRSVPWQAHIAMVAAVQCFLSGGVSKTINMPNDCTVDDVEKAFIMAWDVGCKAISVYRDGCKNTQPLTVKQSSNTVEHADRLELKPKRYRLPDTRQAITHRFVVGECEGYITVGLYDDGSPGEIFLTISKEGSIISGMMDTIATLTSMALQYGVPLQAMVDKFSHVRFPPSGFTKNEQLPVASSIIDYVFRWLGMTFLKHRSLPNSLSSVPIQQFSMDAPICWHCGSLCVRTGSCYTCSECGISSGCA